jgi:hypothetical protein
MHVLSPKKKKKDKCGLEMPGLNGGYIDGTGLLRGMDIARGL